MKEKLVIKEGKVLGFKKGINASDLTSEEWDKLVENYQFSDVFLQSCREQKYYSISEIYQNQFLTTNYIVSDLESMTEDPALICEFYDNYYTDEIGIEDIYYYLLSSKRPNEKFLEDNISKYEKYLGSAGSPIEFPYEIASSNENLSIELKEKFKNHFNEIVI